MPSAKLRITRCFIIRLAAIAAADRRDACAGIRKLRRWLRGLRQIRWRPRNHCLDPMHRGRSIFLVEQVGQTRAQASGTSDAAPFALPVTRHRTHVRLLVLREPALHQIPPDRCERWRRDLTSA